ncbi:hypothetical protein LMIY3S_05088 [Labrys miyagiensis]
MNIANELPQYLASILKHKGFLRIGDVLAPRGPIPVCRSNWWAGIKTGRYPAPVKLGPRTTAWRIEDIEKLIHDLSTQVTA